MTADRLVRLYPRRWRERYADEFVETVGRQRLNVQQVIDIVSGAVDAWISFRSKTESMQAEVGGQVMVQHWKAICATNSVRYTKRDALISAGVMILASIILVGVGTWLNWQSYKELGEIVMGLAFPVAVTVSMPFAILKGQPKSMLWFTMIVSLGLVVVASILAMNV